MSEMTFRETLRMEHAIAENDRTVLGTPVENCIFQKRDFWKNENLEKHDFGKTGKTMIPGNFLRLICQPDAG